MRKSNECQRSPWPNKIRKKPACRIKYIPLWKYTYKSCNFNDCSEAATHHPDSLQGWRTVPQLLRVPPAAESATNSWPLPATFLWKFICWDESLHLKLVSRGDGFKGHSTFQLGCRPNCCVIRAPECPAWLVDRDLGWDCCVHVMAQLPTAPRHHCFLYASHKWSQEHSLINLLDFISVSECLQGTIWWQPPTTNQIRSTLLQCNKGTQYRREKTL